MHFSTLNKWLVAWLILLSNGSCWSLDSVVLVANSSHFSLLHRIETAIYAQPNAHPQIFRLEAEELKESKHLSDTCGENCKLIVAIGLQATELVLEKNPKQPILSILVRKHSFDDLLKELNSQTKPTPKLTAIYLDQPFDRQLNLIGCILPESSTTTKVGVLLGPQSIESLDSLESNLHHNKLKIRMIHVTNKTNAISELEILLEDVSAIWALPDQAIYNSRTARGLLLSAYRRKVPIIGYSRTYVSNGALSAVYSSPKQVAQQTADMISAILAKPHLIPPPHYPDTFSIAVNYQVANSLGLEIEPEETLLYAVSQLDGLQIDKGQCRKILNESKLQQKRKSS